VSKILCFTGTRSGMALRQKMVIRQMMTGSALMEIRRVSRFLHGGCIGADAQFHVILKQMGLLSKVEVYPSDIPEFRDDLEAGYGILRIHEPSNPIARNKTMIGRAHSLLAAPREFQEVVRSGTWMTIREARKKGIPVLIVFPDGHRHLEEGDG
jgi:hypothetical protein